MTGTAQAVLGAALGLALLTAVGWNAWQGRKAGRPQNSRVFRIVMIGAVILLAGFVLAHAHQN